MLIIAQEVIRKQDTVQLDVPRAAEFFSAWELEGDVRADDSALSLRFAIGKHGQDTLIIVGVRREGRGFDIGVSKADWDSFVPAPEQIVFHWRSGDSSKAGSVSASFPEEAFEAFLESISQQAQEFPERMAIVEVAQYFFPEDEN